MNELVSDLVEYPLLKLILSMWFVILALNSFVLSVVLGVLDFSPLEASSEIGLGIIGILPSFGGIKILELVLTLCIVIIVETLFFQFALLLLTKKLTEWLASSDSWLPAFLVTSLVYTAFHANYLIHVDWAFSIYGLLYMTTRISMALALNLLAIVERSRKNGYPIVSVMILHGLCATVPFIVPVFTPIVLLIVT